MLKCRGKLVNCFIQTSDVISEQQEDVCYRRSSHNSVFPVSFDILGKVYRPEVFTDHVTEFLPVRSSRDTIKFLLHWRLDRPSTLDEMWYLKPVACPGILFGGVQQIQLGTEDRENGDLGAVAP